MPRLKKNPVTKVIGAGVKAAAKAAGKKVKPSFKAAQKAKPLANPKSAVKVLPRKTAPKSGLEGRGAKLTLEQKKEQAQVLLENKETRNYMRDMQNQYHVFHTGKDNAFFTGKSGKANIKKSETIKKVANKKPPIKINSQSNLKKKSK